MRTRIHCTWAAPAAATALAIALVMVPMALRPQEISAGAPGGDPAAAPLGEAAADSLKEDLTQFSGFPIVFYTPETGLAAGAAGGYFFKSARDARPSSVSGVLFFTAESQLVFGLSAERYSPEGCRCLSAQVGFLKFHGSFWGIGHSTTDDMEETYTPRTASAKVRLQKRVYSYLEIGGAYTFWYEELTDMEPGGLLDSGEITGSAGGYSSGLSLAATWDRRDNILYTRRGFLVESAASYHGPFLGSDYEYSLVDLDLRYFVSLPRSCALGFRGLLRSAAGDVPFQAMPALGGALILRGYPEGRYRDKASASVQAEFRSDYLWRIALVLFGGMGSVAERPGDLDEAPLRFVGGGGLRVRLNRENFNLRLDVGAGEGTSAFYLVAGEAF